MDDVVIPSHCPILGIKLRPAQGRQAHCSPSLDRIKPGRGYVPGNVHVVSWRANSIKKDATLRELRQLGTWAGNEK